MSSLNSKAAKIYTHEGAVAKHISAEKQLRRTIMSCFLWEDTFYENGISISERISSLIPLVKPSIVGRMAIEARERMKLRHLPLFIVRVMATLPTHKKYVARTLFKIIQRPDELTEFLAIYWKDKKQPLSAQVKKGLAWAFVKFDEYQLAKYNRNHAIKLKDVLFLCHAKPKNKEQDDLWKRLINDDLKTPDTWEVALSASNGENIKETWERLLINNKLGALALLRNLRNMLWENVNENLIISALENINTKKVLPFRFIEAAKHAIKLEPSIERAMLASLKDFKKLKGTTVLLIDKSISMNGAVSRNSDLTRNDAANALAILLREICDKCYIVTFSNDAKLVPARRGFALADAINGSLISGGTYIRPAFKLIRSLSYDRLIVITDEQLHDTMPSAPSGIKSYLINIAAYKTGVGYYDWIHIDGWSEHVISFISEYEDIEEAQ